jgi:hypothetical protein
MSLTFFSSFKKIPVVGQAGYDLLVDSAYYASSKH